MSEKKLPQKLKELRKVNNLHAGLCSRGTWYCPPDIQPL